DLLPSALLQRLSTVNAQLVTSIAATPTAPAPAVECARALKRLRWQRDRAALQREIDRLQQAGGGGQELDSLLDRKNALAIRIEELAEISVKPRKGLPERRGARARIQ